MVTSLYIIQITAGTVRQDVEDIVALTTPHTAFRWEPTGQQWIFNINTTNLAANTTYFYAINLSDRSVTNFCNELW